MKYILLMLVLLTGCGGSNYYKCPQCGMAYHGAWYQEVPRRCYNCGCYIGQSVSKEASGWIDDPNIPLVTAPRYNPGNTDKHHTEMVPTWNPALKMPTLEPQEFDDDD